jgi:adenylylsulfate kinase-like enzyme
MKEDSKIIWITGQTRAGKTTLLKKLAGKNTILLDGDDLRTIWPELGLSRTDRWEQNLRAARLARLLSDQGFIVVVATISPFEKLRKEIRAITGCIFIFVDHNEFPNDPERPYEDAWDAEIIVRRRKDLEAKETNG